ncbi:MAG: FAD-binding protein [Gordonibacter pamelaeae]|uniref:NAD(P)/FAD-dependent oxidoreductase n=1 Tax=Gordonibacter pamelaeae TaxID=471189 RepID=UPI0012AFADA3|nr:FAD-binding protein [Gordonibacter pamelaeae]HJH74858.1 FAD-binding protein [Eggerthellaceae bacterium]MBS4896611.1 FAD-binding protein [Gordonibacter pamelaeae]MCQ4847342.1 FAD-binding protein [Gordonibacter pamelaeae]MCQ4849689.1 FAD-binding protein [Gordonibacter pamelaeae]MSA61213.1 FAD-binding protein [Gordonibacter pamelaeae]
MGAQDTDVVIVGAGPAGIFCALALVERGFAGRIVMLDKGLAVEDRTCPKQAGGPCLGCEPCRITTGFSGAGAFSDGKLSLSSEVGGDLPDLIGHEAVQAAIGEVDGVYLAFGADGRVEGAGPRPEVDGIRLRAIKAGLKLVDCPLRHLGTERARELYARLERHLVDAGVDLRFRTTCTQVLVDGDACTGVAAEGPEGAYELRARHTVVATGRRGADWLERMCREHRIAHGPGPVDIGVRVEVRNEVMRTVNDVLYESKLIGYPKPFKNKVRTFCQNPGGFVSQENYDGGLAVVNGHSYKERKSANTNLAILCSHNFSEPFDQPIAYAQKVGELTNMLGDGRILVQRLGDILDGKRTWDKELRRSNVAPTLGDAVAGDITAAMPYRAMTNILAFMLAVDEVVPGFAAPETLLYSPELKFYSNRVKMDEGFRTSVRGLRCLGDSSGWTRGLMMASVMGYLAGRSLADA